MSTSRSLNKWQQSHPHMKGTKKILRWLHTVKILYIQCIIMMFCYVQAMSPDGEAIVTGAGDETLRFWNVFSKMRSTKVLALYFVSLILRSLSFFIPLSFLFVTFPWLDFWIFHYSFNVYECFCLPFFCLPPSFRNLCQCWTSSQESGSQALLCTTRE